MTDKELDLVLAQGESYRIEFKEELTNLDREMVAFANAGLKPLQYEFSGFVRAVFQSQTKITTQEIILSLIQQRPEITREELAEHIGLTPDGIKYHLDKLRKADIIKHLGPRKRGNWVILKDENDK